ncbi:MAG: indole-3-glycerol phosphate synthase TrpC [Lentisphaerae bacterium]|nr:indole-3-glycerol phosphate synthase TrpC [Lentisphaerota bacterium]
MRTEYNFLARVVEERRRDIEEIKKRISQDEIKEVVSHSGRHRSLIALLKASKETMVPAIIAEVKKGSPSAGVIRSDYNPGEIAQSYEESGAVAISVLTEPRYFFGSLDDLEDVKRVTRLPVLRKDFITDVFHLYESSLAGADVVLLIAATMDFAQLREMYVVAQAIGLEVIVEVHSAEELEMALPLTNAIIGVNNRNLVTLKTNLKVSRELARYIPADRLSISESGISIPGEIQELRSLGYAGFLIGESLLRYNNPGVALRILTGKQRK